MKFNKKFSLTMALIYFAIFSEVFTFEKNLNVHSRYNSKIRNKVKVETYPFKNPLGNFIAGFTQNLSNEKIKLETCLPDNWRNPPSKKLKKIENEVKIADNFSGWKEGFDLFSDFAKPLIDYICENREKVIIFIEGLFLKNTSRKYRFLYENKNSKRAFKLLTKKFPFPFAGEIMELAKSVGQHVGRRIGQNIVSTINSGINAANKTKQTLNAIKEEIINPLFIKAIKPIFNKLMGFINQIKDFFNSPIFQKILDCIDELKKMYEASKKIFSGLKSKFKSFKLAISIGLPGIIIFVIDFIFALVCEYEKISEGIDFITSGNKSSDSNNKLWQYGKATGIFFRVFATTKTFAGSILQNFNLK